MSEAAGWPSPTVRSQELGDEVSLFDTATGTAIALNGSARDIWTLVDGESTVAEIVETLARAYQVEPTAIEPDVRTALAQLVAARVILDHPVVHRMTDLRLASAGCRVDLVDAGRLPIEVLALLRGVIGQLEASTSDQTAANARVVVQRLDGGHTVDGTLLPADPDLAAAVVVSALDRALLATTTCLTVHAAVLAGPRGAVVVPADSGVGKSTLAGAAQQAGLRLVSDEAACLDPERDVVWPHPRPLGLDERSRTLLGLPAPELGPPDGERATSPGLLGPVADPAVPVIAIAVALPERVDATGSVELVPVTAAVGLARLLAGCLNTGDDRTWTPERAWQRLTDWIGPLQVRRLRYATPQEGAEALVTLVG